MKHRLQSQWKNIREYYIHPRRIALLYAFVAFIALLVLWWYVGILVERSLERDEREQIATQVNSIGTSLTLAVNQRLMLITSVQSFMRAEIERNGNFSFEDTTEKNEVDSFIAGLHNSTAGIRNIAIAPDGVMQYVFPYEENKSVLGYEPAQDERPNVREEVRRAAESEKIVLSLPYELIQGGKGLIARQAISVNGNYWGLANVVLDIPPLLKEAGIDPVPVGLNLALKDQSGQEFFGIGSAFHSDPVTYEVKLPEGSWTLVGVPSVGWRTSYQTTLLFYRVLGLIGIVATTLLTYQLINRRERLENLVDRRTNELTQSNQTLITVLESIDADVYVSDLETNEILFANKHMQDSFKDELVGKICYQVYRNETSVCAHCKNKMLLDGNNEPTGVHLWEGNNPVTDRWYQNADRAIRWHNRRFVHLQIATDITEQRRAIDAIRESEERYRNLFNSVPVGIYRSTPEGRFLDGNPALLKILGYPDQETMLASEIKDLYIDENVREQELALIEQSDFVSDHRMQLRRYDGTVIWVQDSAKAIRDSSGQTMHYYGRLENITERVQAEEELKKLSAAVQQSTASVVITDPKGNIEYVNPKFTDLTGYSAEEALGKNPRLLQGGETPKETYTQLWETILAGEEWRGEFHNKKKNGGFYWEDAVISAIKNDMGDIIHFLAVKEDITERKQVERALQEQEDKLQSIFRAAPVGIGVVVDREIREANQMLCQITGYSREEMIGKNARFLYPSDDDYEYVGTEKYRQIKEQGIGTVETRWQRKDGAVRDILLSSVPLDFDHISKGVTFSALDITDRRQAEIGLKKSEERFRVAATAMTDLIWESDHDTDTLEWYGDVDAALGYGEGEFPRTIEGWMSAIHPDDLDRVNDIYIESLASGEDFYAEYRIHKKDGSILYWEDRGKTAQTRDGKVVRSMGAVTDITHRKQAEKSLRMKTEELETLFSISKHLRAAKSADEMLPLVVKEMRNVLNSDTSAIVLLDPDGQIFRYASGDGVLASNTGKKFAAEKSISGMVLQTSKPYITEDLSSDPMRASGLQGTDQLGAAAVVPLLSEKDLLGVLVCARAKDVPAGQFSPSEVQLLTAIGEMVGNALRRARLYDQAIMRLQNVQALRSIDMAISANIELAVVLEVLLAQGSAQLDVDAASVLLLDPHTHVLKYEAGYGFRTKSVESASLRIGDGLPGQVALSREILHVPDLSGSEVLRRKGILREGFISYQAAPLIAKGQLQGVLEMFNRSPIVMDDERVGFLQTLATQAAIAIDNAQLFIDLQRSNFELEMAYDATIEGWSRALELRDQETEGHTLRVAKLAVRLAQAMGVRSEEIVHIRHGALLHDIGKMGVPDRILLKPDKLDEDEWEIMKQHTTYAYEMLQPIEFLRPALDIPHYHHEKWDGTGYPRGLKGEQIPLSARIFAVIDVWDALNSDRPYRKAWTEDKALGYITSNAGAHFDPHAVEAFLNLQNKNGQV